MNHRRTSDLQRLEQNFTSSQQRAHFFRQANGRLQATHNLVGRSLFFFMALIVKLKRCSPYGMSNVLVYLCIGSK